jgi:hypothetical protein
MDKAQKFLSLLTAPSLLHANAQVTLHRKAILLVAIDRLERQAGAHFRIQQETDVIDFINAVSSDPICRGKHGKPRYTI